MATISRGKNGLLVDGEPFDPSSVNELTDEELEKATGGVTIYTKYENHWWGSSYSRFRCSCGSLDWTITGWYDTNQIYVKCTKCGNECVVSIDTH